MQKGENNREGKGKDLDIAKEKGEKNQGEKKPREKGKGRDRRE